MRVNREGVANVKILNVFDIMKHLCSPSPIASEELWNSWLAIGSFTSAGSVPDVYTIL